MSTRFKVVPNHIYGPAVVDKEFSGLGLVDCAPTAESADRIAASLNELVEASSEDLRWHLPATFALEPQEKDRVLRALARMVS